MALQQFFARKYAEAVDLFTEILAKDQLSTADRKKVLSYRLAAHLMLKNDGCFKQDLAQLKELGGYPDYFFDTLARKLSDKEKKMLERRQHLEVGTKRTEEVAGGEEEEDGEGSAKRRKKDQDQEEDEDERVAYSFFFNEMRQRVRDENPGLHLPGVAMKLAEMWRALSDQERAKYKKMHEEAKTK